MQQRQSKKEQQAISTVQDQFTMTSDGINDDLGLLPGTFVRGSAPALIPSSAGSPRAWWKRLKVRGGYEWGWVKARFFDRVGRIHYWARLTNWPWKKKPYFKTKEAKKAAVEKYETMYKAFVSGNKDDLRAVAISGIERALETRLNTRSKTTRLKWEIIKHDRFPRIVCNRATKMPIPGEEEDRAVPTAMRQIVVKLTTTQRLSVIHQDAALAQKRSTPGKRRDALAWKPQTAAERRKAKAEAELEDTVSSKSGQPIERKVTEYIVLHQRMLRGVIEEWKIWGFTEPSTVASIAKNEQFEKDLGEYETSMASGT